MRDEHANGLLIVFVIDDIDIDSVCARRDGVAIATPPQTEAWGERFFQITDPNGVIVQFVQWVTTPPV
jgi:uncharacterized glyoxalase superfamily protein PhnB